MRIVAGQFKGRPIMAPKGRDTRPTSDRARETVFNILAHASWCPPLEGARVMDLFAGSGALGLEALSRGASCCLFIDTGRPARAAISNNIKQFGLGDKARIGHGSATALGPNPDAAYTLVFLDPPYNQGLVAPALASLRAGNWLGPGGIVVVETGHDEDIAGVSEEPSKGIARHDWTCHKTRVVGAAKIWFLGALA